MTTVIYWFRNDLRLSDNLAFTKACAEASNLVPVFIHESNKDEMTAWGFVRKSNHPRRFLQQSLQELQEQLISKGSFLLEFKGDPGELFETLGKQVSSDVIYCEQIEAPEELAQIIEIKSLGFRVEQFWQSSMLDLKNLPFDSQDLPDVFSNFRKVIERSGLSHTKPIQAPNYIPPLPPFFAQTINNEIRPTNQDVQPLKGGELSFSSHLAQYLERRLPDTYKQTRNQLIGMDYSSKFSPWLALGCTSARIICHKLRGYESIYGANEGTYWLWFELLWRDYFRLLHFKYGTALYRSTGLSDKKSNQFDKIKFDQWASGNTGELFVDAGMRELKQTGFLSNRMRQIVASYWIFDMRGDWRAGAAWFESQLIDYDVYSNQGNWLYIAGKGTDPRGGRPFNVAKQVKEYDPQGIYQKMWLTNSPA